MQTKKKILNFKFILASIFSLATIAACGPTSNPTNPSVDPSIEPSVEPSTSVDPSIEPSVEPSTSVDPSTEPSVDPTTPPVLEKEINFDVYTLNDFHGATQYVNQTYPEVGLAKMSTIFRGFAEENTSFFLSSGDMWQETIESNSNYGEYVTVAMNRIGLDAMTVGNHEFDWGPEYITKNAELADYPFLAANIIEKDTGYILEGCQPSTLIERDGLKVGVIGTIGPSQYSSISYQYVAEYNFENDYNHVVSQAKYLREQGADVIILSTHEGYNSSDFGTLKKEMINEASIDMVIAGHTHQKQEEVYTRRDGKQVPMLQGYSSGTAFGHVNFTFDTETKDLTLNSYKIENFKDYISAEEDRYILDLYNEKYNVDNLKNELVKTSHRKYTTGFYFGSDDKECLESSYPVQTHEFMAIVLGEGDGQKVLIQQRNRFKVGDELEVLSNSDTFNKTIKVEKMENEKGEVVDDAKNVQENLYLYTNLPLKPFDILRKKIN